MNTPQTNPDYWKEIDQAQKAIQNGGASVEQLHELVRKHFVDRSKKIKYPIPVFSLGEKNIGQSSYPIPFGTQGNFSTVQGGAKVGKTYFRSLLIAAYIGGNTSEIAPIFRSHRKDDKEILDFDTEQGEWHVHSGATRVDKIVGSEYKNYYPYQLRELDVKQRLDFIEHCIYDRHKNIGLVVIDGVADLVNDVNSLEESNALIQKLMKWSSELNIHIITFIHTNWQSDKATGHLGSAIGKKAETVCDLKRDGGYTNVKFLFCRGFSIDPFRFSLNQDGLPCTEDEMPF